MSLFLMLTIYWANGLLTYLYLNPGRVILEKLIPVLCVLQQHASLLKKTELTVKKPQFGKHA